MIGEIGNRRASRRNLSRTTVAKNGSDAVVLLRENFVALIDSLYFADVQ